MRIEREQSGVAAALSRMADGLGHLFGEHLALARLELTEDARAFGHELGRVALFVPFVLVGYALLCGALTVALSPLLGLAGALTVVAAANLAVGLFGSSHALRRLRRQRMMDDSISEVERSAAALGASLEASHGQ